MVIWSIITGIVSIVSFLIAINDRFKNWNKYLWNIGYAFVGMSLGLLLSSINKIAININADQSLNYLILFGIVIVLGVITYFLIKKGQDILAYVVFAIFLTIGLPKFKDIIKSDNEISKQEIQILAKFYEDKKLNDRAIYFWEKYKKDEDISKNDTLCKRIDEKINGLKLIQIK